MKYHVAISGSYGGLNLGDEAILEVILRELRASLDVDVVVFSRNATDTERRHKVRAVPIREMHKDEVLKSCANSTFSFSEEAVSCTTAQPKPTSGM